jgi:hypothetical protein
VSVVGHVVELARVPSRTSSRSRVISWRGWIAALIAIIFFIPIRRYTLPVRLGFQLEPYRVLVGVIILGWVASLLSDARARVHRTGFEGPMALIVISVIASDALNTGEIQALGVAQDVLKSVTFFASYLLVFYFIASVLHREHDIDLLIRVSVVCAATVAALSVVEWRTGSNIFNHLHTVFPFLQLNVVPNPAADITGFTRGGRLRVFASAEHPIALGAVLLMVAPLAVYLAVKTRRWWWWLAMVVLGLGAMATVSRTGVVMMVVIVIVYLWLRPRQTVRFWPAIFPILLLVHVALPNTLGILKGSLFPAGGVKALAQEQGSAPGSTSGRIAKIAPTLHQVSGDPLFGVGYGTQVLNEATAGAAPAPGTTTAGGSGINPLTTTDALNWNAATPQQARILDDQWLGTLLETGFVGVIAYFWLFSRLVRRLGRAAKEDPSERGWLLVGITAAVASFAVSMLFYDAFAFIQVTFVLWILMSFAALLLRGDVESEAPARSPA